ncbi:MAG: DUF433 domain-containing protein [Candidatus Desulfofervidaceae bacterium]|nr:DUF433 domain-containing protein [Candidatus Desulfofervidaceae bacterium]
MKEIAPGIVVDKEIKFGKPVIKNTRVPVDVVLGKLAAGLSFEEIMEEYDLKKEDILNAIAYAARIVGEEQTEAE